MNIDVSEKIYEEIDCAINNAIKNVTDTTSWGRIYYETYGVTDRICCEANCRSTYWATYEFVYGF